VGLFVALETDTAPKIRRKRSNKQVSGERVPLREQEQMIDVTPIKRAS
jgi:hypothetical protein